MDISHDSKLIVTCSSDKNVKIWGLDFGDCHKSLFAHDESVMQVAFERNDTREGEGKPTHYFWTVGKDKMRKYCDGDKIELIVGGGVRSSNIGKLRTHLGLVARADGDDVWVHSSCLTSPGDEAVDETEVSRILTEAT